MNEYERSYLGNIVIIENIVFNQSKNKRKQVDHSWYKGRPCVIFFTDEEYDYYAPLSSTKPYKKYYNKIKNEYFELSEDDFLFLDKGEKIGVIHISECFRKKISGYPTIGKLTEKCYDELIKRISAYQKESPETIVKKSIKR